MEPVDELVELQAQPAAGWVNGMLRSLCVAVSCFLCGTAVAGISFTDDSLRGYFTPALLFSTHPVRTVQDEDSGLRLGVDRPIADPWRLEVSRAGHGLPDNLHFGGMRLFDVGRWPTPFVSTGIARYDDTREGRFDRETAGTFGVGLLHRPADNLSLRAEARYLHDFDRAHPRDERLFMISASWNFGTSLRSRAAYHLQPGQMQPERMPPPPEPVDRFTVPLFEPVYFAFDSDRLDERARASLDDVVLVLDDRRWIYVEVIGSTCDIGPLDYNLELSARRARAVHDHLVSRGVDPSRLVVRGGGVAISDDVRERSRRTELHGRSGGQD